MIKQATPLLVVAALAGCGADASTSTSAGSQRDTAEDARVRFAQCMREQGVEVPDPGEDGRIRIGPGPGAGGAARQNPERFQEAEEKCREHLEGALPELSDEQREEFQDQALAFARCMREQGIDFPDPEFGEGGMIRQRLRGGIDPQDPRFREAEEKCDQHRPQRPEAPAP